MNPEGPAMSRLERECAAMAARMMDAELIAITSKIEDEDELTPLQEAVVHEWRKRSRMDTDLSGFH